MASKTLKVSMVQTATHWHDPAANRAMFDDWLMQIPAETEVVMLPEMFSTGFTMASQEQAELMDGPTVSWLLDAAKRLNKTLCGSVVIAADEDHSQCSNRLLWVTPDAVTANNITCYDKRHRFRMAGEHEHFEAGQERVVVTHNGVRILLQVCYDLRFPVFARNRDDYDVYLIVANWPAARQQHWNTLLAARAIENQCYVVAVNCVGTDGNDVSYSGGSGLFSFTGEPQSQLFDEAGVISGELDITALEAYRQAFPAWQDADAFSLGALSEGARPLDR